MPFGPFGQAVRPSSLSPRSHYSAAGAVGHDAGSASSNNQGPWACDYCQVATFQTYEEASEHEKTCPMNQDVLSIQSQLHYTQNFDQIDSRKSQTMVLTMPRDKDSLSDRQCYVRSHFVELFAATEVDVASRHSKGAQKLHIGQIGIRCKHCTHIRSKDRAERAMCYPSSISRIYQTVADMQRFHFAACTAIPPEMKSLYKTLKTTRPRGVGSPQAYWISSAEELGLVDSDRGIRYEPSTDNLQQPYTFPPSSPMQLSSVSSISSSCSINSQGPRTIPALQIGRQEGSSPLILQSSSIPPLSPATHSTTQSLSLEQSEGSEFDVSDRDSEANMLLALKNTRTDYNGRKSQ
jgi:hypothetical protein